ncbi:MAG: hypothetical protein U1E92_06280 [Moraxella osloensis]
MKPGVKVKLLAKQTASFNGVDFVLLDVVILRESLDNPVIIRLAVNADNIDSTIQVNDYIQANIWLQGTIFMENQKKQPPIIERFKPFSCKIID